MRCVIQLLLLHSPLLFHIPTLFPLFFLFFLHCTAVWALLNKQVTHAREINRHSVMPVCISISFIFFIIYFLIIILTDVLIILKQMQRTRSSRCRDALSGSSEMARLVRRRSSSGPGKSFFLLVSTPSCWRRQCTCRPLSGRLQKKRTRNKSLSPFKIGCRLIAEAQREHTQS